MMPRAKRPTDCVAAPAYVRLRPPIRPLGVALACTAGLLASGQASARDYESRDVGGWTVAASKDGKGCFLSRDYDRSGTTALFGLDTDGANRLSVLNANWSIKPRERLKLNFRLSNSSYPAHFAVGLAADGKQGFVTSFGPKFPSYFATSKTLYVSRGDVPVERLALDGAGAAVAELKTCVDSLRNIPAPAAAGKARSDDIPKDPFARSAARESKK